MIEITDHIRDTSAKNLVKLGKDLQKVSFTPIYNATLNSRLFSSKEGLNKILLKIPLSNYPVIYRISCQNTTKRTKLLEIYNSFHELNKKRTLRVDRINMSRLNKSNSSTLYIGSTKCLKPEDFRNRMQQHLGGGNFRTYALQLSKWHHGIIYNLSIEAINVIASKKDCLSSQLIELIEQTYWDEYKPVFGKKAGL